MRGIVYTVWGNSKKVINDLYANNKVAKKFGYPTCLLVKKGTEVDKRQFNFFFEFDNDCQGLHNKGSWSAFFDFCPFDTALFLDVDAFIVDDIFYGFRQAELHHIALTIAPASSLYHALPMKHEWRKLNSFKDMIQYNTGAIFIHRNDTTRELLYEYNQIMIDNNKLAQDNDQPMFSLALSKASINPFVLPNTWNLRQHLQDGKIHGPVKIWHGQYPSKIDLSYPQQGLYKVKL